MQILHSKPGPGSGMNDEAAGKLLKGSEVGVTWTAGIDCPFMQSWLTAELFTEGVTGSLR